jgi:DNA invertase Pin-like site-specific DNA recombinase
VFSEYGSGAEFGRAGLQAVLSMLREGDTLVATEVSRLTRRLPHLLTIIDIASERKVKLSFGSIEFDFAEKVSAMQLAMLQMMGIFAELERNLDCERIGSGIENARAKGARLGRPKTSAADVPEHVKEIITSHARELAQGTITKTELAKTCKISRPTLNKYISLLGVNV